MKRYVVVGLVLAMSGCGGAAPPSAAPSSDGERSNTVAAPENVPQAQHTNGNDGTRQIAGARGDLDRAESQVNAAMSDCATACRALASMERAAEHLCALDGGHECSRARERLAAAKERVRSSCGGCGQ